MSIKINKELAVKVIETVKPGLCHGLGDPEPGKMCVEAAVNYACGLPHGDSPSCVGNVVRDFKINLNDQAWSTNKKRANGMIKIAIAQLGSNKLDQNKFRELVIEEFVQLTIMKEFNKELNKILNNKKILSEERTERIYNLSSDYYAKIQEINIDDLGNEKNEYFPKMRNDKYYRLLADICLIVLKKMKSPGCKYLYLLNK